VQGFGESAKGDAVLRRSFFKAPLLAAAAIVLFAAQSALPPELNSALESISADSLRGHVSFLASDLLEGRGTPSRSQDIAAEYIAAQFRRAGLEAAGDDGYFQTAKVTPPARNRAADAPPPEPVTLRNVVAVLRGSDPALKDTCIILSAHYDHLGVRPAGEGDRIFNGANDDASGTTAVLEIAAAFAGLRPAPRRSIVFIAFAGEERGLLGSRYYAQHPVFPAEKTVAGINLEQLGRTDDVTGPVVLTAYVTGFDYSDIGPILQQAGVSAGVTIARHETNNDKFFTASDNRSLAEAGIPAHTVSVGFIFPDYHQPGDEWQKLDYGNMEKIVRAVALGVYRIASSDEAPDWNPANPRTERYRKLREAQAAGP
jgi:Zn-dependent M28 family amino/carboxypeptidase